MKYLLVLALLAAVAWLGSDSLRNQGQSLSTLDAAVEPELRSGWKVSREPELPGPYRRVENPQHVPRGTVTSITYGLPGKPTTLRLPVREDTEQIAIPLRTADGSMTVVVLER